MKNKNKDKDRYIIPSFVYLVTVGIKDRRQITNRANLKRFSDFLMDAISMKKTRNVIVDALPSPIPGVNSYSVNQPLKTSIQSIDTWPEKLYEGAIVILIHSCMKFDEKCAAAAILRFFEGAEILLAHPVDHTYYGKAAKEKA